MPQTSSETLALDSANPSGPRTIHLALRRWAPSGPEARPVVLVHGLASNALMWTGVAEHLAAGGHPVVAIDQRGHGQSAPLNPELRSGFTTAACAEDLIGLCAALGWAGDRAPVLVGQSWGGNVALAAARIAAGLVLVDGGWLDLGRRFSSFADCWARLAPPDFSGLRYRDLVRRISAAHADWPEAGRAASLANLRETAAGGVRAILDRDFHREILESMWSHRPARDLPALLAPTLLLPAGTAATNPAGPEIHDFMAAVPQARVIWFPGAHHDLHAQHPDRVATALLTFAKDLP
ncbi:MAG: alpha/beta fold hydrolase [Angustibacter sp.]